MAALILNPLTIFLYPARLFTATGCLFDIAGVLRVFSLEELSVDRICANQRFAVEKYARSGD
jgi:hypothetical protein